MDQHAKIYVAGHHGLVGSAIVRNLAAKGYTNIVGRSHAELDLLNQTQVQQFFDREQPDVVVLAAAKVGGIWANSTRPAEFIYENLMMESNIIHAAYQHGVKRLLFLGSSCIYPQLAPQPIQEQSLMTGPLEPTNDAYAVAKIAGIYLCKSYNKQYGTKYISVMPTNLYGPNDNFDLESSHVMPALIRKFHEAKNNGCCEVVVWGSGTPVREFLHVDDMADACVYLLEHYDGESIVNIGTGVGITIRELAELIREIVGFQGNIVFDATKPDGTPVKINDTNLLTGLGWQPKVALRQGIEATYHWYVGQLDTRGL